MAISRTRTLAIQVQTLPLEGPRILRATYFRNKKKTKNKKLRYFMFQRTLDIQAILQSYLVGDRCLEHFGTPQKPNLRRWLWGFKYLLKRCNWMPRGSATYHNPSYPPASSKGCCLNPKGWCRGAPLIIHETHPLEDLGIYKAI